MIDHKNEIIFIHIPRTGGTSIEKALIGEDFWNIDPRNKHATCHSAKEVYRDYWDNYFKFSFIRNPWDRHVSMMKYEEHFYGKQDTLGHKILDIDKLERYTARYGKPPNTIEFDYRFVDKKFFEKFDMISGAVYSNYIGSEMDFIGRFENLQNDFNFLTKKLDLESRDLPITNVSNNRTHYSNYYNEESRDLVKSMYNFDINKYKYSYDEF